MITNVELIKDGLSVLDSGEIVQDYILNISHLVVVPSKPSYIKVTVNYGT